MLTLRGLICHLSNWLKSQAVSSVYVLPQLLFPSFANDRIQNPFLNVSVRGRESPSACVPFILSAHLCAYLKIVTEVKGVYMRAR
jgi:hypothetical protein